MDGTANEGEGDTGRGRARPLVGRHSRRQKSEAAGVTRLQLPALNAQPSIIVAEPPYVGCKDIIISWSPVLLAGRRHNEECRIVSPGQIPKDFNRPIH